MKQAELRVVVARIRGADAQRKQEHDDLKEGSHFW
jgi:hypothetical protein